jgi:hypothetical protein
MTKRFGRPAPTEQKAASGLARKIHLPREGHALEGAYAEASALAEWRSGSAHPSGNALFARHLTIWGLVAMFAIAIAAAIMPP